MKGIFNLSNKILTRSETSVLNKGLKFAPSNRLDKFGVFIDLQRFKRKLSLKKYFLKQPVEREVVQNCTPNVHTTLKNRSKFYPRHMVSDEIKMFEGLVMKDIEKLSTKLDKQNLTKEERMALKDLQKDPNIIIKPADKGGGIVIWSKESYKEEALRLLDDNSTYTKLTKDPVSEIRHKLIPFLQEGLDKNILNKSEFDYLSIEFTKVPHFYILPKVHKDPLKPPGRPIVAGIDSISSRLSEYVDVLLQPLVCKIPSHLKDTISMLQLLKGAIWQKGDLLVTCDVHSYI
uniref:Uncharacterized protein n=1 Tax=Leptobrachium leishanense TaxID=445787 RepID=A0A8C5PLH9_9ANUR